MKNKRTFQHKSNLSIYKFRPEFKENNTKKLSCYNIIELTTNWSHSYNKLPDRVKNVLSQDKRLNFARRRKVIHNKQAFLLKYKDLSRKSDISRVDVVTGF